MSLVLATFFFSLLPRNGWDEWKAFWFVVHLCVRFVQSMSKILHWKWVKRSLRWRHSMSICRQAVNMFFNDPRGWICWLFSVKINAAIEKMKLIKMVASKFEWDKDFNAQGKSLIKIVKKCLNYHANCQSSGFRLIEIIEHCIVISQRWQFILII